MFGSQDNQDPVSGSPIGAADPGTSSDPIGAGAAVSGVSSPTEAAMPDLSATTAGASTEPTLSEVVEVLKRIEETLARIEAKSGGSV